MTKKLSSPKFYCKSKDGKIVYTYDDQFIYAQDQEGIRRLDVFDQHYYKLRIFDGVPILEIDGLRMQLVRDFETPLDYSHEVVAGLKISKSDSIVLDTCMGLGYTAIASSKSKLVSKVITCEFSQSVLLLAKWSPMSSELFEKKGKIEVLQGSSFDLIKNFPDSSFSYVIHDPPRFSHAPDLYSEDFYRELFRVSKKGARLFHYVGSVGVSKGRQIEKETELKLKSCGFTKIKYSPRLQGLYFEKPSTAQHPDQ